MENKEKEKNVLKMFGTYLKNVLFDFITSFKYNNMKLAGLLVCVPGVFLGFFLSFHAPVVKSIAFNMTETTYYKGISFDPTGILLFLLILSPPSFVSVFTYMARYFGMRIILLYISSCKILSTSSLQSALSSFFAL